MAKKHEVLALINFAMVLDFAIASEDYGSVVPRVGQSRRTKG